MMLLLGMCTSETEAEAYMAGREGSVWVAHVGERDTAPYRSMFAVATDELPAAREAADAGLHLIYRRVIKAAAGAKPSTRVVASFGMVRHPDLEHAESDAHWRDVHGPLALRSHSAMCDYEQLSIVTTLHGDALDGMAMCAFPDRETLSTSFFDDDDAKAAIIADVSTFANTRASLPRVVLTQTR